MLSLQEIRAQKQQTGTVTPQAPVSTPAPISSPAPLQAAPATEQTNALPSMENGRGKIYSGGTISDILDTLSIPGSALASFFTGVRNQGNHNRRSGIGGMIKGVGSGFQNIVPGVQNRTNFSDFARVAGVKNKYAQSAIGLAGDLIFDPLNKIGLLNKIPAISKATTAITDATKAEKLLPKMGTVGSWLGKNFIYRYGQPAEYVKAAEGLTQRVAQGEQKAVDIGRSLKYAPQDMTIGNTTYKAGQELSTAAQQRLAQILRGSISSDKNLTSFTDPAKKALSDVWDQMVNAGLVDKNATRFKNQYLPNFYRAIMEGKTPSSVVGTGGSRINDSMFISRKGLAELGQKYLERFPNLKNLVENRAGKEILTATQKSDQEILSSLQKSFASGDFNQLDKMLGKLSPEVSSRVSPIINDIKTQLSNIPTNEYPQLLNPTPAAPEGLLALPKSAKHGIMTVGPSGVDRGLVQTKKFTLMPSSFKNYSRPRASTIKEGIGIGDNFTTYPKALQESLTKKQKELAKLIGEVSQQNMPRGKGFSVANTLENLGNNFKNELGIVKEAAFPAAKGIASESKNAALGDFFNYVAKNYASDTEQAGMKLLPKADNLGSLAGKYVPDYIHNELVGAGGIMTSKNAFEKFMTQYWKPAKTVLNPGQQARNAMSNQILNYLVGGTGAVAELPNAIKEYRSAGKYFQEAKQAGVIGSGFANQEINALLDGLGSGDQALARKIGSKIGSTWGRAVEKGGNIQSTIEDVSKLQQFMAQRKAGKSVEEAAQLAEKALFNYGKVTPFERKLRQTAIPFYTFTRKSVPLLGETAIKHPTRLTAFRKGENAIQNLSQERSNERKLLPTYMRDQVRLPTPKSDLGKKIIGNKPYLSTQFVYPWGNVFDESALPFGLNIPAVDLVSKVGAGYDPYYKAPLTTSPRKSDQIAARVAAGARTLLPTFPLNTLYRKYPQLGGSPEFIKSKMDAASVLGDVTGVKINNLNIPATLKSRQYDVKDLTSRYEKLIQDAAAAGNIKKAKSLQKELQVEINKLVNPQ